MKRYRRIPGTIVFLALALTVLLIVVLFPLPLAFVFITLTALTRTVTNLLESPPVAPVGLTLPAHTSRAPPVA